jgi:hypothetical protein
MDRPCRTGNPERGGISRALLSLLAPLLLLLARMGVVP